MIEDVTTPMKAPQSTPTGGLAALRPCPTCGAPIPLRAPEGLCPRCLLASSLQSAPSPRLEPGRFTVPSVEALQPLLPSLQLEGLLGRGGMGVVYRARDRRLDRPVAIKVLPAELAADPEAEARFEREARALARLGHPFIVHLYDFGEAGPFFYLLMELVEGRNLRGHLRAADGKPLRPPVRDVLRWGARLCEALELAHGRGVVHRDIKPENIIIDAQGNPRLTDFGLAKLVGVAEGSAAGPSLTGTHQLLGSPHYMPPEQLAGGPVDHRTDLYALGAVLYEALTGTLPLGRFPPPSATPGVPASLDPIVLKLLARDPPDRHPDAASLRSDLEAELAQLPAGRRWLGPGAVAGRLEAADISGHLGRAAATVADGARAATLDGALRIVAGAASAFAVLLSAAPWLRIYHWGAWGYSSSETRHVWQGFALCAPMALVPLSALATIALVARGRPERLRWAWLPAAWAPLQLFVGLVEGAGNTSLRDAGVVALLLLVIAAGAAALLGVREALRRRAARLAVTEAAPAFELVAAPASSHSVGLPPPVGHLVAAPPIQPVVLPARPLDQPGPHVASPRAGD